MVNGKPKAVMHDNGKQFTSKAFENFLENKHIKDKRYPSFIHNRCREDKKKKRI